MSERERHKNDNLYIYEPHHHRCMGEKEAPQPKKKKQKKKQSKGEKGEKRKIPKFGATRRAQIKQNELAKIVIASEAMSQSFEDMLRYQSGSRPAKKRKTGGKETRPCAYYNWRGCGKPAKECIKAGFKHVPDMEAYKQALNWARQSMNGFGPNMPMKRNIADFRRKALENSGGRDESLDSALDLLDRASEHDDAEAEYTEYDPELASIAQKQQVSAPAREPATEQATPLRTASMLGTAQQMRAAFTPGTATTSPVRRGTSSTSSSSSTSSVIDLSDSNNPAPQMAKGSLTQMSTSQIKSHPALKEAAMQDQMAMEYKRPTVADQVREFEEKIKSDNEQAFDDLKKQKQDIVDKYVAEEQYHQISSDPNIKEIDKRIRELHVNIEKEIKAYTDMKTKEEKEKEKRCFGALEFESTREIDRRREPFKHRFEEISATSLGPFTARITNTNRKGIEQLYHAFYQRMCSLEKSTVSRCFTCAFCTRSLHGNSNPAFDKTPSGWVLCRRCFGAAYCCGSHREAHRHAHEFSCALHPGWQPPVDKPQVLRTVRERAIEEPKVDLVPGEFAKDVRKIMQQHKGNLAKLMMVLDPSTIKHHQECACIGCVLRRDAPGKSPFGEALSAKEIRELRELSDQLKKKAQESKKAPDDPPPEASPKVVMDDDDPQAAAAGQEADTEADEEEEVEEERDQEVPEERMVTDLSGDPEEVFASLADPTIAPTID